MTRVPVVGPNWDGYSYPFAGNQLARVHFDVQAAEETAREGHSECLRVILYLPLDRVRQDGQPISAAEMESLLSVQRALLDRLTSDSVGVRFVGSMLYGGVFDLVFQVEPSDTPRFKAATAAWALTARYRHEVRQSAGWDFFDAKVRPNAATAQQIADRKVIQKLIEAGSDPTKVHVLEHEVCGPPDVLRRIARDLESNGFANAHYPKKDVLVINRESRLELFEVWNITGKLQSYCATHGARYSGWGASVAR